MLNVQEIKEIIKEIDESSINEFTYKLGESSITMKKAGEVVEVQSQPRVERVVEPQAPVQVAPQAQAPQVQKPQVEEKVAAQPEVTQTIDYDYEITSPMVGSFYASSSPEADAFVKPGSKVNADSVVCIVEAMKLFNEIEAEVNGEIVEVLAQDGELVEYNQPLFRVKTK